MTASRAGLQRLALGVLMPGFAGTAVPDWLRGPLQDGLGGVCLFGTNIAGQQSTRLLCAELREHSGRLAIGIDEEGGDVTRLHAAAGSPLPGNAVLGELDDESAACTVGEMVGAALAAVGINLDLAPVLDVASEPANPVIGTRSFGGSPQLVTRMGRGFVDGLHRKGVAACGKHFPGHGDTAVDSHVGLPVITASRELLLQRDVAPFMDLLGDLDAVMTAHILVPALGPDPASLAPWCYRMLREACFQGVAVTDALGMRAVSADDVGPAVVRALAAGADLCCLDSPLQRDEQTTFHQALDAVVGALSDGVLDPGTLELSAERTRALPVPAVGPPPDPERMAWLGLDLARRAVRSRGSVRLGPRAGFLDLRRRVNHAAGAQGRVLAEELSRHCDIIELGDLSALGWGDELGELPLVVQVREPLAEQEGRLLAQVLHARPDAVVVHCGLASAAPQVQNLVLAHGVARPNARAAAELLGGVR